MAKTPLNRPVPSRVKQYKIVSSSYKPEMESGVMDLLSRGWICQGGVSCSFNDSGNGLCYHQAMTRETPEPR